MAVRLSRDAKDFSERLQALLASREKSSIDIAPVVTGIIADIRRRGDAALLELTARFDRVQLSAESLRVRPEDITRSVSLVEPEVMRALKLAAQRIRAYAERQFPEDSQWTDETGVRLGWRWTPLDAVGLYVPGGKASYPSSVLMNAVLAKVAGVPRIVMCVPTPDGVVNHAVLAAAHVAGVDEIYTVGGAQAVAALAYGTDTITPVDKIVGPGNAYVAEAKRQVFGTVGIDMIAGPSEILVVADGKNNPAWIAADLLSQAEHDELAQSILITDDTRFATAVEKEIARQLTDLPKREIAEASWRDHGAVIVVSSLEEAAPIVNLIAPEHLELAVEQPDTLAAHIRHAGAIFYGRLTPEAIGDYLAGPSHVLPTSRTARFASGLSVLDFLKRTSLIGCEAEGFSALAAHGEVLAAAEGLEAHGRSMRLRRKAP